MSTLYELGRRSATSAGTVASPIMNAKRRASGLDGNPAITDRISRGTPHHREDRTGLDHHGEDPAGSLKPMGGLPISGGRSTRLAETGEPLQDSQERRLTRVGMMEYRVRVRSRGAFVLRLRASDLRARTFRCGFCFRWGCCVRGQAAGACARRASARCRARS